DELDLFWQRLDLAVEPLHFGTARRIERAIKGEDHYVVGTDGIVAVALDVWEALEVVFEGDREVSPQIVISKGGIDLHSGTLERRGLLVEDTPLRCRAAVRDEVSGDQEKCGFLI